jgi:hypothetical protein
VIELHAFLAQQALGLYQKPATHLEAQVAQALFDRRLPQRHPPYVSKLGSLCSRHKLPNFDTYGAKITSEVRKACVRWKRVVCRIVVVQKVQVGDEFDPVDSASEDVKLTRRLRIMGNPAKPQLDRRVLSRTYPRQHRRSLPEGSKRIDADGLGRAGVACAIAGDTLEIKLAAAQQDVRMLS